MYSKRKLKPFVLPTIGLVLVFVLLLSVVFTTRKDSYLNSSGVINYVHALDLVNGQYVIVVDDTIMKPFVSENVTINVSFYDTEQPDLSNSIIYYENTYMPNSGVDYTSSEMFDIVAVYQGSVIKVEDNSYLGKTIQIRHENGLISIYQSLSDVIITEGEYVQKGQVIAKSGSSLLTNNTGNNLHFEINNNGEVLNPEECYYKSINQLQ